MKYFSTRDINLTKTSAQAIYQGLSSEGGLFVPQEIPRISMEEIESYKDLSYTDLAVTILSKFLTDFSRDELTSCICSAYADQFNDRRIAPIHMLDDKVSVLELWHGPTCAFKDMALQLLPHLLVKSKEKLGTNETIVILVATSGDTGKAALEGFKDVEGTKIIVFYPENGVSHIQKLQMQTQEGKNVCVCAIKGNFDDAQTGVKKIFSDDQFKEEIFKQGNILSSANSINWGRLVPQIVYYFSAYAQLRRTETIRKGEEINFSVPTGNFGDILAAYYAKSMGLPINRLICASNKNNILTDFIRTGTYDRNRDFYLTSSPSMDILISSNLERLIFHMCGDDGYVRSCFEQLAKEGRYTVSSEVLHQIQEIFDGQWAGEEETASIIKTVFEKFKYLIDTHTATAVSAAEKYLKESGDTKHTVIVSTASPYKFADSVLSALGEEKSDDDFETLKKLFSYTGTEIPQPLLNLSGKPVYFTQSVEKTQMADQVYDFLSRE